MPPYTPSYHPVEEDEKYHPFMCKVFKSQYGLCGQYSELTFKDPTIKELAKRLIRESNINKEFHALILYPAEGTIAAMSEQLLNAKKAVRDILDSSCKTLITILRKYHSRFVKNNGKLQEELKCQVRVIFDFSSELVMLLKGSRLKIERAQNRILDYVSKCEEEEAMEAQLMLQTIEGLSDIRDPSPKVTFNVLSMTLNVEQESR